MSYIEILTKKYTDVCLSCSNTGCSVEASDLQTISKAPLSCFRWFCLQEVMSPHFLSRDLQQTPC